MSETSQPQFKNHILSSLPPEDYERLAPHMETVELKHGQILYRAEQHIEHVYFPSNSMVSLISETPEGESVEVGICGYEGMVGISALLGVDKSAHLNLVQIHDGAVKCNAKVIMEEFQRGEILQSLLLRYMQSLLLQILRWRHAIACTQSLSVWRAGS